jgi:D-inositol-3-phosphate glycosyltransferase
MRVAMVSEHASPLAVLGGADAGGQNVHVAAIADSIAARGHDVVVYTRRDSAGLPTRVALGPGVVVEHLDAGPPEPIAKDQLLPYVPELGAALRARLQVVPPHVVHGHFWMSGLAAVEATRGLDIPVVQTFHALGSVKRREQGTADTSPPGRVDLERSVARSATRIIASCTDERRELIRLGARLDRLDIIPSGVDLDVFTPAGPRSGRTTGRHRLLVVGRLVPRKGVDDAIRTLKWLPDAELVVAGGPDSHQLAGDPEAVRLLRLAGDIGVADRVTMLGRVPHTELPKLIRSADVVVCLPWYEPFGIVPLEAMACGTPVVGSAVGGLLDTVVHGRTGLLVPPRRSRAAARAIRALLDDEPRRRKYGLAGRKRSAGYSWSHVAQLTERTYLRATAAASHRVTMEESVR